MNTRFEMIKKNSITQIMALFALMFMFIIMKDSFKWAYDAAVYTSFVIVGYVAVFSVFAIIGVIKDIFND
jgi:hypothetical protein